MFDEIKTHDDSNKKVRVAFSVDSNRINHYSDFIEYLVRAEVARCKEKEGFTPTKEQLEFFRKEATRYAVIRRDMDTAQNLRIRKSPLLMERA